MLSESCRKLDCLCNKREAFYSEKKQTSTTKRASRNWSRAKKAFLRFLYRTDALSVAALCSKDFLHVTRESQTKNMLQKCKNKISFQLFTRYNKFALTSSRERDTQRESERERWKRIWLQSQSLLGEPIIKERFWNPVCPEAKTQVPISQLMAPFLALRESNTAFFLNAQRFTLIIVPGSGYYLIFHMLPLVPGKRLNKKSP